MRVIVGVRAATRPEGRLSRSDVIAQRSAIRDRQERLLERMPSRLKARARRFSAIPFFAADVDADTLTQLQSDPDVISIEEDRLVPPALAQSVPLIGGQLAWAAGLTGQGWTIASLDTGVDSSHPFLSGKIVSEACYSNAGGSGAGTSLCPGGVSTSTASGSAAPCRLVGCDHGTHVAGIAAGDGASFSGVARDASLIPIQIYTRFDTQAECGAATPCFQVYTSDMVFGLERVLALKDAFHIAAANLSLGGTTYSDQNACDQANPSVKAAIDNLRSVGIATVISAGNDSRSDALGEPGCISSAVSVGSTTKSDVISSFSNTAPFLSLLAPGSSITSSLPGGGFGVRSGTSMAAPHVAGAWALLKQRRPSASVSQILSVLQSTGVRLTNPLSGLSFPRIRVDAAASALPIAQLSIDTPLTRSSLAQPFVVAGWATDQAAISGTGIDAVHIYAYPSAGGAPIFLGAAAVGHARADVGALYGAQFANSGFTLTVGGLSAGDYRVVAYGHSTISGTFDIARTADITVVPVVSAPQIAIDAPAPGAVLGTSFFVGGWALDRGIPTGLAGTGVDAVHVYAYPLSGSIATPYFLGIAAYGGARPDVAGIFGTRFASSGYGLVAGGLPPGPYRLVVYAHSTVSGAFSATTRDVTVRPPGDPAMVIDTPASGAAVAQPFTVAGWAIDRDAPFGAGVDAVHVWGYPVAGGNPIFLGAAAYGGMRSDISAIFGAQFSNSGYGLTVSTLSPGAWDVVVYAYSSVTGSFNNVRVVRVTVQ